MYGVPTTLTAGNNPAGLNTAGSGSQFTVPGIAQDYSSSIYTPPGAVNVTGIPSTTTPPATNASTDNHPVLSANGSWVSSMSGTPWHGSYNNPNGTTQYYSNGQQVSDIGQVGLQTPQLGVQQLAKNPAISGQVNAAVDQNQANTGLLNKSFSQYLQEAQNVGTQGAQTLAQGEAAINPAGTVADINSTVSNTGNTLAGTLANLTAQQQQNQSNIASANQGYQQNQNAALGQYGTNLTNATNAFGSAALAAAQQGYANALKQTNLYQLGTGTPGSGSGQLSNRYIADYNNVMLPVQAQIAQQNLANTQQLYGLGSGLQNQYLQNLQGQYAGQGALNQSLASQQTANAQYMAGLGTNAAQYLQGLQQQIATLSPQLQAQYLQSLGVPIQVAQAIMSGNTANLAALTNLNQAANFTNVYGQYQNQAPSFISPNVSMPGYGGNFTGTAYSPPPAYGANFLGTGGATSTGGSTGATQWGNISPFTDASQYQPAFGTGAYPDVSGADYTAAGTYQPASQYYGL